MTMKKKLNGALPESALEPTTPATTVMTPTESPVVEPDWKTVAQMAMQQRDRMASHANNVELDLAIANLKIEKFEAKELGISVPELRERRAVEVAARPV
jgi:hypothetical protein